ncbi:cation diffusion facilitator family transporter [Clostridiaceae bacterium 35-E11]
MHIIDINNGDRMKLVDKVIRTTIILNVLLTMIKIGAGYFGNSSAIIADGLHSASDIATSVGVVLGMLFASKPKDEQHQYGHEKAESIAGFILAAILILTGINIGYQSLKTIFMQTYQIPQSYTAIVALISIVIKEYQFRITAQAAKELNSNAMMGDAWHHRSDAFSSIAALVGIIGARLGYAFLDPLAGTVVSVIVVKIGFKLLLATVDELMDGAIDIEQMKSVAEEIKMIQGVKSITEFRGRKHGSKGYIDIKICVDARITVHKGHTIGEKVEQLILDRIVNIKDVVVHIDPCHENKDNIKCASNCKDSCH